MSSKSYHVLLIFNRVSNSFCSRTLHASRKMRQTKCANYGIHQFHGVRDLHTSSSIYSIYKNNAKEQVNADFPDYGQPLESWHYDVNTFGRVVVNSPMSIHVQPLDPQKHPTMDKIFLNVLYVGEEKLTSQQLSALTKNYIVNVNLDDRNEEIDVSIKYKNNMLPVCQCHLQIPIKYDVAVSCKEHGDASLENLEGEQINVRTQLGHCYFKSIKSGMVDVKTKGGGIISRSLLQGNLNLTVAQGDGGISAGRLQGQSVQCETSAGDIQVKAVYAGQSHFATQSGNVRLGNCHGSAQVNVVEGDLIVDTMDGDLTGEVTAGDTSVYVAREGDVSIKSNMGNVLLKVPDGLNSEVDLEGSEVRPDKVTLHNLHTNTRHGSTKVTGSLTDSDSCEGKIEVCTTGGTVKLQYQDWFSTLNLSKDNK